MAHAYHHAVSSAKRFGGSAEDYQPIHDWLDGSKLIIADFRHRALRHHAEGCFAAEALFGTTITNGAGKTVPVRLIAEQHILEDLGRIPSFADWVRCIRPEPWMGRIGTVFDAGEPTDGRV
ncbi:MAG: hypothetical protein KGH75_01650 [Rhodospirillales bacterium]|nr:hypothetical protein [Rhodospirillales bacterium]